MKRFVMGYLTAAGSFAWMFLSAPFIAIICLALIILIYFTWSEEK